MPATRKDGRIEASADCLLGEEIGRGGVGIIQRGRQRSLDRDIAVKSLLEPDSRERRQDFIVEARVTGELSHPNIVPVHFLTERTADGPMLGMKLVEGCSWRELLDGEDRENERAPRGRSVDAQLDILQKVCDAVAFAHDRGVVHCDLKPANVMVGSFGEVLVMDWGLALDLPGDGAVEGAARRRAADLCQPCGTPHYMAPELAAGAGSQVGPWTDVYLLGGLLHEILVGRPPHAGESFFAVLNSAISGPPPSFDGDVNEDLAEVCRRALSKGISGRYQSAKEMQAALFDVRSHQASKLLTRGAEEGLDALRTRLAGAGPKQSAELEALARRVRFGLESASTVWPDNPRVPSLRSRLLVTMTEAALASGDGRGAERLLDELEAPPPELRAAVAARLSEERSEARELAALRAAHEARDLRAGSRVRGLGFIAFACVAVILDLRFLRPNTVDKSAPFDGLTFAVCLGMLTLVVAIAALFRWRLARTEANRTIADSIFVVAGLVGVGYAISYSQGLSHRVTLYSDLSMLTLWTSMLCLLVDARLWPAPVIYGAALITSGLRPAWMPMIITPAHFFALTSIGLAWQRAARAQRDSVDAVRGAP